MEEVQLLLNQHKQRKYERDFFARVHYAFKVKFGMSYQEFLSLPIPTAYDLLRLMQEEAEETQRQIDKHKTTKHGRLRA